MENEEIKFGIIVKMDRKKYWGHRMINFSDLVKVVSRHLRKEAKKAVEELYKEGYLNKKPGIKLEFRYSLNLAHKREIDIIIAKSKYV